MNNKEKIVTIIMGVALLLILLYSVHMRGVDRYQLHPGIEDTSWKVIDTMTGDVLYISGGTQILMDWETYEIVNKLNSELDSKF